MDRANVILSESPVFSEVGDPMHVRRNRLLERLAGARGVVLVEAPTGFGKSILCSQIAAEPEWKTTRVLNGSDIEILQTLVDSVANGAEVDLIVIDDVSPASLDLAEQLSRMGVGLVVCAGRRLKTTPGIRQLRPTLLRHVDLRFDLQETHRLLRVNFSDASSDQVAYLLHSISDGWPEHVERIVLAMVGRGSSMDVVRSLATRGAHLDPLVDRCLDGLESSMLEALAQLTHLGRFSTGAANSLSPDLVPRAMATGFPILENNLGELVVPELLASRISQFAAPDLAAVRRLIPIMVGTLGMHSTTRALLSAGATTDAANLICSLPEYELDSSNQTEMIGLLRAIEAQHPENSELTFRRARVHRNLAQFSDQRDALERVASSGPSAAAFAAEVELFVLSITPSSGAEALQTELSGLESNAPEDADRATRIRLREARALILCTSGHASDLQRSVEIFREVAAEWEMLGDRPQSASALRRLALGPLVLLGRCAEGASMAGQATLLSDNPLGMAASAQAHCRLLALSGQLAELDRSLAQSEGLVNAVGVSWLSGYMHWTRMLRAGLSNNISEARRELLDARLHLGELLSHSTGTIFHAEAAQTFARLGDSEQSLDCLSLCSNSDDMNGRLESSMAEITHDARLGDPDLAEQRAQEFLQDTTLPPDWHWRVHSERLVASDRAEVAIHDAEALAERVRSSAARLGLDPLARKLLSPVRFATEAEIPAPVAEELTLTVLGTFGARSSEGELSIPAGNVSTLLKVLVVADEPRSVDHVIDRLWPDATLDVGRRRLKNVTSRLRKISAIPLVVRTASTLELAPTVSTDLRTFRSAAQRAIAEPTRAKALPLCVDALNLYAGPLLPGDMYDDELSIERSHAEHLAQTVFEALLDTTDTDSLAPAWLFETALRLGIRSDQMFVRIAEQALTAGADLCASLALREAEAIAADLGVPLLCDERLMHLLAT